MFLLIYLFILKKHHQFDKKIILNSLILFVLVYGLSWIFDQTIIYSDVFLVIKRKENYAIITNGFNNFYIYIKGDKTLDFLDIVRISGELEKIDFVTLESSFDFNEYLYNNNVLNEINIKSYELIFNFPLDNYFLKERFLSSISDLEIKNLIGGLIFSSFDYSLDTISIIKELQIFHLFSLSGIYLNFVLYGLKKLYSLNLDDKISSILALTTLSPLLLLNINSFVTIKVLCFFIFNFVNKEYLNYKYERIEIISLLGIIFIFVFPKIILQSSFYISFIIYYFLCFTKEIVKDEFSLTKKIIYNVIIFILMIPFTLEFNNSINILSIFLVFIISPFSKIIYVLSLLCFLGIPISFIGDGFQIMIRLLNFLDNTNLSIHIPPFNSIYLILYFSIVFVILYLIEIKYKLAYKKMIVCLSMSFIFYSLPLENQFTYQVSFLNVGQGDSIFIRIKNRSYLIDTGGLTYKDVAKDCLIPFLKKNRIYSLDSVFITHHDYDHNGALDSLKENFRVKNIYDYYNFHEFDSTLLNITNLNNFGIQGEENDRSLVLYLVLGDYKFLFMGDATKSIEEKIIANYQKLDVDILKVGHHGSNTSSSKEFLEYINPKEAVISVGKNNYYNHPSSEVISTLNNLNIKIRRTDLEGTITYKINAF